jgi:hypothetical protein
MWPEYWRKEDMRNFYLFIAISTLVVGEWLLVILPT